jgi:hypothetical protein
MKSGRGNKSKPSILICTLPGISQAWMVLPDTWLKYKIAMAI